MSERMVSGRPEPWEQSLFALWDVVTQTREKEGRPVADQLARMALEAVTGHIATPAKAQARKTPGVTSE